MGCSNCPVAWNQMLMLVFFSFCSNFVPFPFQPIFFFRMNLLDFKLCMLSNYGLPLALSLLWGIILTKILDWKFEFFMFMSGCSPIQFRQNTLRGSIFFRKKQNHVSAMQFLFSGFSTIFVKLSLLINWCFALRCNSYKGKECYVSFRLVLFSSP